MNRDSIDKCQSCQVHVESLDRTHKLLLTRVANAFSLRADHNKHNTKWQPSCPTDHQRWQGTEVTAHTQDGMPNAPSDALSRKVLQPSGLASKTMTEPQPDVARHPEYPVSISDVPDPFLFSTSNYSHSSSPEVLARRLIGTWA